jgi:hypothetical protein
MPNRSVTGIGEACESGLKVIGLFVVRNDELSP